MAESRWNLRSPRASSFGTSAKPSGARRRIAKPARLWLEAAKKLADQHGLAHFPARPRYYWPKIMKTNLFFFLPPKFETRCWVVVPSARGERDKTQWTGEGAKKAVRSPAA